MPTFDSLVHPYTLMFVGVMLGALGWFLKNKINGTAKDIVTLKDGKVDRELWATEHKNLVDDVKEIRGDVKKISESLNCIQVQFSALNAYASLQTDLREVIHSNSLLLERFIKSEIGDGSKQPGHRS
jgi:hypothetical protein